MQMINCTQQILQDQEVIRERLLALSGEPSLPIELNESNLPDAGDALKFLARFPGATA